jgi:MFS family permease
MFLVLRTMSGLAGAGAFAIVGGSLADLWTPKERAQAMSFFAATTLAGPCMGPVLGSLIVDHLHWYGNTSYRLILGNGPFKCKVSLPVFY